MLSESSYGIQNRHCSESPSDVSMKRWQKVVACAAVTIGLCYVLAGCFLFGLERGLGIDEHMYLAPCVLVSEGFCPYRDFAYPQTPLMPLLYGALFLVLPATFTTGRLLTVGFGCATGVMMAVMLYRRTRSYGLLPAAIAAAFFCLSLAGHPLYPISISYVHNGALAVFLCTLGFMMVPKLDGRPPTRSSARRIVAAGVFMGLACSTRILFALVGPALVCWIPAVAPKGHKLRLSVRCALGVALGVLPCAVLYLAGPGNFMWNVFYAHSRRPGLESQASLASIGGLMRAVSVVLELLEKDYLAVGNLLFLTAAVALVVAFAFKRLSSLCQARDILAIIIVVVLTATTSCIPLYAPHYFATATPFALWVAAVFLAWSIARLREKKGVEFLLVSPLIVLSLAYTTWFVRYHIDRASWRASGIKAVQADAARLQELLGSDANVLTLTPCVSIEAGYPPPRDLAYCYLGYKWAERIPPELAARLHLMTARDAEALLAAGIPEAGIAGLEGGQRPLEEVLARYYRKTQLLHTGTLYLRPDIADSLGVQSRPARPAR